MLQDAVYYSRREADERALALGCTDPRVHDVHQALADKYAELARLELSALSPTERRSVPTTSQTSPVRKRASNRIR